MRIKILSFDLDGTLIGDKEATRRFRDAEINRSGKEHPLLCYNTGRLFEDTLNVIEREGLPHPDYCICGVGTMVYDFHKKEVDGDFLESLREGWNRETVSKIMSSLDGAVLQPGEFQNDFKSSWYLKDAGESQIDQIRKLLRESELNVNVVYSSSRDLDILPRNATKGNALLWLLEKLDIQPDEVLVGGDTGNDSSMFLLPGVKGIIVANAKVELTELKDREGLYSASKSTADGVLEGLIHFGVFESLS